MFLQEYAVIDRALTDIVKAGPPGLPPRPGLVWKPRTHRWIRPLQEDEAYVGDMVSVQVGGEWVDGKVLDMDYDVYDDTPVLIVQLANGRRDAFPVGEVHVEHQEADEETIGELSKFLQTDELLSFDVLEELHRGTLAADHARGRKYELVYSVTDATEDYVRRGYRAINEDLRAGRKSLLAQEMQADMRKLTESPVLYRSTSLGPDDLDVAPGGYVYLAAYASTSRDLLTAASFNESDVLMEIRAPDGTRGLPLSNQVSPHDEFETVLDYGQYLRVEELGEVRTEFGVRPVMVATVVDYVPEEAAFSMSKASGPPYKEPPKKPPGKEHKVWNPRTGRWRNSPEGQNITVVGVMDSLVERARTESVYSVADRMYREAQKMEERIRDHPGHVAFDSTTDEDAMDVVQHYTIDGYLEMNQSMRNGQPSARAQELSELMVPLGEASRVYRGESLPMYRWAEGSPVKVGSRVLLKSFMSTSRNPATAMQFVSGETAPLLEIEAGPDARGMVLANEDTKAREFETVIDAGQWIEVVEIIQRLEARPGVRYDTPILRCKVVTDLELSKAAKGPPYPEPSGGPPLGKEGKEWNPQTARWRNPVETDQVEDSSPERSVTSRTRSGRGFSEVGFDPDHFWRYADHSEDLEEIIEQTPAYQPYEGNEALAAYVGMGYGEINERLRDGEVLPEARQLSMLMRPLGEPYTVYRGVDMDWDSFVEQHGGSVEPGDLLSLTAFTSTSRNPQTSWNWGESGDAIFLEIQTASDTRAVALANVDTLQYEYETILDYGQCLAVEQVDFYGDYDKPVLVCAVVPCGSDQ